VPLPNRRPPVEAESVAVCLDSGLVEAWATLPDAIKAGILAMIRAAGAA